MPAGVPERARRPADVRAVSNGIPSPCPLPKGEGCLDCPLPQGEGWNYACGFASDARCRPAVGPKRQRLEDFHRRSIRQGQCHRRESVCRRRGCCRCAGQLRLRRRERHHAHPGQRTAPGEAASAAGQAGPPATRARVSKGSGTLPNDQGQVWREYDIRPYTNRVANTARPEQAIVDWILRETGYEAWHSDPVGLLERQPRHAPRLSHAGDAGGRGRYRRPLRQLGRPTPMRSRSAWPRSAIRTGGRRRCR